MGDIQISLIKSSRLIWAELGKKEQCFILGKVSKKKIVEYSTKGSTPPPPPSYWEKFLLAKNDLHVMKRILYDTGPRVVARWSRERILKLSKSVLVKRPPTPLKMEKKS